MDRTARPLVIVTAFAASLLLGLLIMLWALGGVRGVTAPAAIGGPFQLTDQSGATVTDKNLVGRPTLIFFGFTHCPDVCPTALFEISEFCARWARMPIVSMPISSPWIPSATAGRR